MQQYPFLHSMQGLLLNRKAWDFSYYRVFDLKIGKSFLIINFAFRSAFPLCRCPRKYFNFLVCSPAIDSPRSKRLTTLTSLDGSWAAPLILGVAPFSVSSTGQTFQEILLWEIVKSRMPELISL